MLLLWIQICIDLFVILVFHLFCLLTSRRILDLALVEPVFVECQLNHWKMNRLFLSNQKETQALWTLSLNWSSYAYVSKIKIEIPRMHFVNVFLFGKMLRISSGKKKDYGSYVHKLSSYECRGYWCYFCGRCFFLTSHINYFSALTQFSTLFRPHLLNRTAKQLPPNRWKKRLVQGTGRAKAAEGCRRT